MNGRPSCPTCGGDTVERAGRRGTFWGCRKFPDCMGTINIGDPTRRILPKTKSILASQVRLCPVQIACDGATLLNGRNACGACERAQARRARPTPLRGERCADALETPKRRKGPTE